MANPIQPILPVQWWSVLGLWFARHAASDFPLPPFSSSSSPNLALTHFELTSNIHYLEHYLETASQPSEYCQNGLLTLAHLAHRALHDHCATRSSFPKPACPTSKQTREAKKSSSRSTLGPYLVLQSESRCHLSRPDQGTAM